jgi:osmoprotectant transport system ATP-binding protein
VNGSTTDPGGTPDGRVPAAAHLSAADGPRAASVELRGLTKRFEDGTVAVHDVNLTVAPGELVALVGPSGCGKTTTLRMVNRLIEPTSGEILLDGVDVTGEDPVRLRRRIGYVIQQVGLFPHETVAANIATVPKLLGWDKARVEARVHELLDLVGLPAQDYARRYPHQLSGGQRQRVGVARALAADPPVLLMDEPFSAIDPIQRDRLQAEFLRVQAAVRKTVLFVTHDLAEAVRLADRIAVFREGGHLEQVASPAHLLGRPQTDFVARFVGADRALRRLAVTVLREDDVDPVGRLSSGTGLAMARAQVGSAEVALVDDDRYAWATDLGGTGSAGERARPLPEAVPVGTSLQEVLARLMATDAGLVPVSDGERLVGVMTPDGVHAALRRDLQDDLPAPRQAEPADLATEGP